MRAAILRLKAQNPSHAVSDALSALKTLFKRFMGDRYEKNAKV